MRLLPVPDDHGCFDARPAILRGLMYPLQLDKVRESNIKKWLEELSSIDSIRLWVAADGISYGIFPAWSKHQRIRSIHQRKTPEPPDFVVSKKDEQKQEDASNDVNGGQSTTSDGQNHNPNPNPKKTLSPLALLWNELCPSLPKTIQTTKGRLSKENTRLKERDIPEWENVFLSIESSDFCKGLNDRGWLATFDWIIENDGNAVKVLEGKYNGSKNGTGPKEGTTKWNKNQWEIFRAGKWEHDRTRLVI